MATVEVTFTPLPAHVRTARLVATAVARRSGVDETLLDEVRLAVGEACSRAVEAHRRHCPADPVRIEMTDSGERFTVTVSDHAPAPAPASGPAAPANGAPANGGPANATPANATPANGGPANGSPANGTDGGAPGNGWADAADALGGSSAFAAGFGLAVISGLADDVRVLSTSSGVSVRMSWPATAARP
jgi:hypothetical protein